jgi:hypothetical protein
MNLLEHYIKEIHSEEEMEHFVKGKTFVRAKVTTICYGTIEKKEVIYEINEWKRIKSKGYYLA